MTSGAGWFVVGLIALAIGAEVMVRGGAQLLRSCAPGRGAAMVAARLVYLGFLLTQS